MKDKLIQNGIAVRPSPIHGYGVFAEKPIKNGEVVEECRFLLTDGSEAALANYYYDVEGKSAFLTGFGVLYNHSDQPNLSYFFDVPRQVAVFTANRSIQQGEELFISYGTGWFSARDLEVMKHSSWQRWLHPKFSLPMRALLACSTACSIVHLLALLK